MGYILFFNEDNTYQVRQKLPLKRWMKATITAEGFKTGDISFILCSDAYLLEINKQYLQHDTYTDIVTFDSSEGDGTIDGDIFISIDRIKENASKFGVSERDELHRVMIHGVLHLCGYGDKGKEDKERMTAKEDFYLSERSLAGL